MTEPNRQSGENEERIIEIEIERLRLVLKSSKNIV